MLTGIIYALSGAVLFSIGNALSKHLVIGIDTRIFLLINYTFITVLAAVFLLYNGEGFILLKPTLENILFIVIWGVFGYAGIYFLLKGFQKMNLGVVMTVAYSYIFFSYFLNYLLLGSQEDLSLLSIILGILFFFSISRFLFISNTGDKKIDKSIIYPILTAICWTLYFSGSNFFIKENIMSPLQTKFYSEVAILVLSIIPAMVVLKEKLNFTVFKKSYKIGLVSFFTYLGGLLSFYAFSEIPGNIVNILSITTVIVSAILGVIFLKEKMSRQEIGTMSVSVIFMFLFILSFIDFSFILN